MTSPTNLKKLSRTLFDDIFGGRSKPNPVWAVDFIEKVLLHLKEQVQKETAERCAEIAGSLRFDTRVSIDFLWMKDKQISLKKNNEEIGKATAEAIRREFLDA